MHVTRVIYNKVISRCVYLTVFFEIYIINLKSRVILAFLSQLFFKERNKCGLKQWYPKNDIGFDKCVNGTISYMTFR